MLSRAIANQASEPIGANGIGRRFACLGIVAGSLSKESRVEGQNVSAHHIEGSFRRPPCTTKNPPKRGHVLRGFNRGTKAALFGLFAVCNRRLLSLCGGSLILRGFLLVSWLVLFAATANAATPTIVFDSSNGSDTAASGSGGTAITAGGNNGASTTSASATVDLSADSPDLSSLASPTGAEVLWVDTSSGRQFSAITSVNNSTKMVTCADAFSVTASNMNWGIGGKRATWDNADSRTIFAGAKDNWIIETETDQTITGSAITISALASIHIRGAAGAHRVINQTANAACFSPLASSGQIFNNLKFTCSNGTKTSANALNFANSFASHSVLIDNCVFGDATNSLLGGVSRSNTAILSEFIVLDSCFQNCTGVALSSIENATIDSSYFKANAGDVTTNGNTKLRIFNSIFEGSTTDGINSGALWIDIRDSTWHAAAGDNVELTHISPRAYIKGNNFTGSTGGWGLNFSSGLLTKSFIFEDFNNYGTGSTANSSGALNGISQGANSINVDPGYVNAGSSNFAVGTNVKGNSWPTGNIGAGQSASRSYRDFGAVQRQETGVYSRSREVNR